MTRQATGRRYVVRDENDRPVIDFDVAFHAVASRRINEPVRDAWNILDTRTGIIHR